MEDAEVHVDMIQCRRVQEMVRDEIVDYQSGLLDISLISQADLETADK